MPVTCANGRYVCNIGPFHSDWYNNDECIYRSITDVEYLNLCKVALNNDSEEDLDPALTIFSEETIDFLLWFNENIFKSHDVMVADRGYNDIDDDRLERPLSINPVSQTKYKQSPHSKRKKRKRSERYSYFSEPPQKKRKRNKYSVSDSNKSIKVTFCRHTVERDFGRLKHGKY